MLVRPNKFTARSPCSPAGYMNTTAPMEYQSYQFVDIDTEALEDHVYFHPGDYVGFEAGPSVFMR